MARKLPNKAPAPVPDVDAIRRFWHWMHERHSAWYAREVLHQAPPWCEDEIVQANFFTNVYRELDPGTQFILAWLPQADGVRHAVFWALAYRLAFHEHSMDALLTAGVLDYENFRRYSPTTRSILRSMDKPFQPAYVVSNYGITGAKVDVIVDVLMGIADTLRDNWPFPEDGMGIERKLFVDYCRAHLHGIGDFVAFQALVDLSYTHTGWSWLPTDNNGWVVAGPGALKGLSIIFPNQTVNAGTSNRLIHSLCHMQEVALPSLYPDFPGWGEGGHRVHVDASNMQNCCCEFSKYERIRCGGKAKRSFRAAESHERDRESRGHGQQLEMSE